ncbi:MAG: hypothetical protein B7C24_11450 [Bacteroidetes bacterium 4572_77]|nr:MAG: hypothetical protein B7C24_11450 [Bacteroidetes bacterium 4572_77]
MFLFLAQNGFAKVNNSFLGWFKKTAYIAFFNYSIKAPILDQSQMKQIIHSLIVISFLFLMSNCVIENEDCNDYYYFSDDYKAYIFFNKDSYWI